MVKTPVLRIYNFFKMIVVQIFMSARILKFEFLTPASFHALPRHVAHSSPCTLQICLHFSSPVGPKGLSLLFVIVPLLLQPNPAPQPCSTGNFVVAEPGEPSYFFTVIYSLCFTNQTLQFLDCSGKAKKSKAIASCEI